MSTATAREAMLALQARGVAAGIVHDARGLFADPHLRSRGFFVTHDHASAGRHDYPGLAIRLSATPPAFRSAAPRLGEHNREVLEGLLGYTNDDIKQFQSSGVIAERPPQ